MTMMRAIGFTQSKPIDDNNSLFEFSCAKPVAGACDLLVKVSAVALNPVDTKVRTRAAKDTVLATPRIAGYDAVGIVESTGSDVSGFKPGDRVYYAGDINRPGSNAEFQLVDYRIAALAPRSLSDAEAAALPLTTLTGWEALFDRMRVDTHAHKTLLIIGGAGGVGSITTQIAKQLTNLTVIATASRAESRDYCLACGADALADHRDLVNSVRALGHQHVDYIFNTADTSGHWDAMCELIAPQGTICSIVEFSGAVNLSMLQGKSATFVWELMFTRSIFKTADMQQQQRILREMANLVDCGRVKTTLRQTLHGFSVENLKAGHGQLESGSTIGKLAISF